MNDNHINKMNVDRQPELPQLVCDLCGIAATVVCTTCANGFGYEHKGMCEQCWIAHNNDHLIIPVESFRIQVKIQSCTIETLAKEETCSLAADRHHGGVWLQALQRLSGIGFDQWSPEMTERVSVQWLHVHNSIDQIIRYMECIDEQIALNGQEGPISRFDELCGESYTAINNLLTIIGMVVSPNGSYDQLLKPDTKTRFQAVEKDPITANDSMNKGNGGGVTSESGSVVKGVKEAGQRQQIPSRVRRSASASTVRSAPGKVAKAQKAPPVYYKGPPRVHFEGLH